MVSTGPSSASSKGVVLHLDAAQSVDHLREAGEIDGHEPVDGQPEIFTWMTLTRHFRAAEGVGRVQFGAGLALSLHSPLFLSWVGPCLPVSGSDLAVHPGDREVRGRDRDHPLPVGGDVHQHDRYQAGCWLHLGIACAISGFTPMRLF